MANYSRVKTWATRNILTASDLNAEFDNIINNTAFTGTWEGPFRVGTLRVWDDSTTGCIRVKRGGDPSSITDGKILLETE